MTLRRQLLWRGAIAAVLVAATILIAGMRRRAVQAFFHDARTLAPPPALALPDDPALAEAGLDPVDRVRVVLVDGVGHRPSFAMPAYHAACERGLELTVDVGFPTVSLPVQHVLWTGLTQQQSGIQYRPRLLDPPPLGSIPSQVSGSVAVAEYHPFIVHSLGFTRALPPDPKQEPEGWREAGFLDAARAAVASDSRLVFVHILRVDTAGHKHGAASAAYRDAMAGADAMLAELVAAGEAAHPDSTRWFVLSDHGHRDEGGHAGAEPYIRQVRGCIAGALEATAPPAEEAPFVHLVDISRAIADSLGVPLPGDSAGRPLYAAMAAPIDRDATIPRPTTDRWVGAVLVLVLAVFLTAFVAGRRWILWPWWWLLAYASVRLFAGVPTLSNPMIYKPLGRDMYMAGLPGLFLLAILAALALRRHDPLRVAIGALAIPAATALGALILCGGLDLLLGVVGDPPLMPRWTAHTSLFAVLFLSGTLVVALAVLANAVQLAFGRGGPPGSPRRFP